tara:strand:- start:772 stop:999 length:228 start_codon:yes stop_codon:yes gene_type:complete
MLPQCSLDEYFLEVAENWLLDCYEEDGIEPEYFYINKKVAQMFYGKFDLEKQFYVIEYNNGMVKLTSKEEGLFVN